MQRCHRRADAVYANSAKENVKQKNTYNTLTKNNNTIAFLNVYFSHMKVKCKQTENALKTNKNQLNKVQVAKQQQQQQQQKQQTLANDNTIATTTTNCPSLEMEKMLADEDGRLSSQSQERKSCYDQYIVVVYLFFIVALHKQANEMTTSSSSSSATQLSTTSFIGIIHYKQSVPQSVESECVEVR
ncbi:unnamed protein product [Ceratitis capitata]|uniref:(Mediterranean fruit fly) hypothetical protein n=1 Tax=Ceratitis capitata TaxID=7213 RepID=A0A811UNV6_CERCA|nr:unnamed protein product [Ceratitis capitata]